jgi:hypothetical protein
MVCCCLLNKQGFVLKLQVGIRHAEIRGHQLLHNNQPVMIKGAYEWQAACSINWECIRSQAG